MGFGNSNKATMFKTFFIIGKMLAYYFFLSRLFFFFFIKDDVDVFLVWITLSTHLSFQHDLQPRSNMATTY